MSEGYKPVTQERARELEALLNRSADQGSALAVSRRDGRVESTMDQGGAERMREQCNTISRFGTHFGS